MVALRCCSRRGLHGSAVEGGLKGGRCRMGRRSGVGALEGLQGWAGGLERGFSSCSWRSASCEKIEVTREE